MKLREPRALRRKASRRPLVAFCLLGIVSELYSSATRYRAIATSPTRYRADFSNASRITTNAETGGPVPTSSGTTTTPRLAIDATASDMASRAALSSPINTVDDIGNASPLQWIERELPQCHPQAVSACSKGWGHRS